MDLSTWPLVFLVTPYFQKIRSNQSQLHPGPDALLLVGSLGSQPDVLSSRKRPKGSALSRSSLGSEIMNSLCREQRGEEERWKGQGREESAKRDNVARWRDGLEDHWWRMLEEVWEGSRLPGIREIMTERRPA